MAIIVAGGLFFFLIKPVNETIQKDEDNYNSTKSTADTLPEVKSKLKKAKLEQAKITAQWATYQSKFIPTINFETTGLAPRIRTLRDVFWQWPDRFGQSLTQFIQHQPGITLLTPITIPAEGSDPNSINMNLISYSFPIQVEATDFNALMQHINRWNDIRKLGIPVIQSVPSISGMSPHILCNYTVTLYILPKGTPPPIDPRLASGAGARGFGMGGPMGMMGGPGFMSGGMMGAPMGMGSAPPGAMAEPGMGSGGVIP